MEFSVSCLEVNTNGTSKEEPTPASESRSNEKDSNTQQVQQRHSTPPAPPERTSEKEKEKSDKDKSGGKIHYWYNLLHLGFKHNYNILYHFQANVGQNVRDVFELQPVLRLTVQTQVNVIVNATPTTQHTRKV